MFIRYAHKLMQSFLTICCYVIYLQIQTTMKKKFLSIALLFAITASLSSCFVNRDPHGRSTDKGHNYPHDEHHDDGKGHDDKSNH
jgi:hypothetical protein